MEKGGFSLKQCRKELVSTCQNVEAIWMRERSHKAQIWGVVVQVLVGFGLGVLCYLFDGSESSVFVSLFFLTERILVNKSSWGKLSKRLGA